MEIIKILKEDQMVVNSLRNLLKYADQLQFLNGLIDVESKNYRVLDNKNKALISDIQTLQNKLKNLNATYIQKQYELKQLTEDIKNKYSSYESIQKTLENLLNNNDYSTAIQIIDQKVHSILANKKELLIATIVTVIHALRTNPNLSQLIIDQDNQKYEYKIISNPEDFLNDAYLKNYITINYRDILDIIDIFYNIILKAAEKYVFSSFT